MSQFFSCCALYKQLEHGGHAAHRVHMILFYQAHGIAKLVGLLHHLGRADIQVGTHSADPTEAVIHGQHTQCNIILLHFRNRHEVLCVMHNVSLAQHGSLRTARSSGCINDRSRILFFQGIIDKLRPLRRHHLLKGHLLQFLFPP